MTEIRRIVALTSAHSMRLANFGERPRLWASGDKALFGVYDMVREDTFWLRGVTETIFQQ